MESISKAASFAASPQDVFAVLTDPAFQESYAEQTSGLPGSSATVSADGDTVTVETVRLLPTDSLPDFVRSVAGDSLRIVETRVWGAPDAAGGRVANLNARVSGAPVTITGTMTLAPDGGGSTLSVDGKVKAEIFLVGGKIEKASAPFIAVAVQRELDLLGEHLTA